LRGGYFSSLLDLGTIFKKVRIAPMQKGPASQALVFAAAYCRRIMIALTQPAPLEPATFMKPFCSSPSKITSSNLPRLKTSTPSAGER
jgi:hypothetical protein